MENKSSWRWEGMKEKETRECEGAQKNQGGERRMFKDEIKGLLNLADIFC